MKTRNVRRRQRLAYARRMGYRWGMTESFALALRPHSRVIPPPSVRTAVARDRYERFARRQRASMARVARAFRAMSTAATAATPAIDGLLTTVRGLGPTSTPVWLDEVNHFEEHSMDAADIAQSTDRWYAYAGTIENETVVKIVGPVTDQAGMPSTWGVVDRQLDLIDVFKHDPTDDDLTRRLGKGYRRAGNVLEADPDADSEA